MANNKDDVSNVTSGNLTYMNWYEHVKEFIQGQWKKLAIYSIGGFGVVWGIIEAISFFLPQANLGNIYVLCSVVIFCLLGALYRCIYDYVNDVPQGLEGESSRAHRIATIKKRFWEYALAHELINNRIINIDQELDDIINNRAHVKITRALDVEEYIQWMQTRPQNLLRMIEIAKQLLIFDLINAIHTYNNNEIDFRNLIKVSNHIKDLYKTVYQYEVEGRELMVPDEFKSVHEIQSEWVSVIRNGFHQMLDILSSVATRSKDDLSPINGTITFEEPPRIDEFLTELDRIVSSLGFE